MRHKKTVAKLGLKKGPRKALLRGLATSFIMKGTIKTTETKAKALRSLVERHITKAKKDELATRRRLLRYYYDEKAVEKLLKEIAPKYKTRKGGYTRIIKLVNRKGDNAAMALIEFV